MITYGSVSDDAGEVYKTVQIGTQTWMAENLNYAGASGTVGVCYNNRADSCTKYGRLYTWDEVMNGAISSTASPSGVKGICPTGWHVPSDSEWTTLTLAVGNDSTGAKLKSGSGWIASPYGGNTIDAYGFRALPAGRGSSSGDFSDIGIDGTWWTATENEASDAWDRYISNGDVQTRRYHDYSKTYGRSLRCLKDTP
jgi:uncharacterized protein (TIGR02145 family)